MFDTNNAHYLNYYVQVPLTYISSLVLTFLTFCMSGVYYYFLFFFSRSILGFLHNRVATLVATIDATAVFFH